MRRPSSFFVQVKTIATFHFPIDLPRPLSRVEEKSPGKLQCGRKSPKFYSLPAKESVHALCVIIYGGWEKCVRERAREKCARVAKRPSIVRSSLIWNFAWKETNVMVNKKIENENILVDLTRRQSDRMLLWVVAIVWGRREFRNRMIPVFIWSNSRIGICRGLFCLYDTIFLKKHKMKWLMNRKKNDIKTN